MKTALLEEVVFSGEEVAGKKEFSIASKVFLEGGASMDKVADLVFFLVGNAGHKISGKLISAVWDNWGAWPENINQLDQSDVYTLRRINGRERNMAWGDK
jgi:3-oxoacyl-[acyl-carrier protein] reductase